MFVPWVYKDLPAFLSIFLTTSHNTTRQPNRMGKSRMRYTYADATVSETAKEGVWKSAL